MELKLTKHEDIHKLFGPFENLRGVEQMESHHPEGDAFEHSCQVLRLAFRESNDPELILAAMVHDVGKIVDTKGHEDYALQILGDSITEKQKWLVKQHMRIRTFLSGEMWKLSSVTELANHKWLPDLVLLSRWDNRGRKPNKKNVYDRVETVDRLNELAKFI